MWWIVVVVEVLYTNRTINTQIEIDWIGNALQEREQIIDDNVTRVVVVVVVAIQRQHNEVKTRK